MENLASVVLGNRIARMSTVRHMAFISVEDYLARELVSQVKHEYVDGSLYALGGTRNVHNIIAGNALSLLHAQLRGKKCRPFNSDTKIRIQLPTHSRFYYPDVSVVGPSNPLHDSFQDAPVVIVEVLSKSTRRFDTVEKKDAYLTISSLSVYLLVEQDSATVTAYRRTERGFVPEVYDGMTAIIELPEIEARLPLAELYETVEFVPEPEPE
jgi:Uma2 family endonuclease